MHLLTILLVSWMWPQSIDMVAQDDTLFITMDQPGQAAVFRFEGFDLVEEMPLGSYDNLSIGYTGAPMDPCLLVACGDYMMSDYGDSLFMLDTQNLDCIWKTGDLPEIEYFYDEFRIVFTERWHPESRLPRIMSYYCTHVTKATDAQGIVSAFFDPATPPGWTDSLYHVQENVGGWIDDTFFGPVNVGDNPPLTAYVNTVGYWWPPDGMWVEAHVHELESDTLMRVIPVASCSYTDPSSYPMGYCLGSSANEAVLLWSDTSGTIWSTSFSGNPLQLDTTAPYGYTLPAGNTGVAASRYPEDEGILISYYRDGFIRARYRECGWFAYEHQVAPAAPVTRGEITVCGVTNGYWIAWTEGGQYPCLAYISRETLTGVGDSESTPINRYRLDLFPNPFNQVLTINVNCNGSPLRIDIYDSSGHLVHSGVTDPDGSYGWNAMREPSGTYLVRVEGDDGNISRKVLLMR
jgi:hypothetical protein